MKCSVRVSDAVSDILLVRAAAPAERFDNFCGPFSRRQLCGPRISELEGATTTKFGGKQAHHWRSQSEFQILDIVLRF